MVCGNIFCTNLWKMHNLTMYILNEMTIFEREQNI